MQTNDVVTLDALRRLRDTLMVNTIVPPTYFVLMHEDQRYDLMRLRYWRRPATRSASARKRKATRYWRK